MWRVRGGNVINFHAEREGFEPPGLLSLPLSRRVHLSALPPFRPPTYRRREFIGECVCEVRLPSHLPVANGHLRAHEHCVHAHRLLGRNQGT